MRNYKVTGDVSKLLINTESDRVAITILGNCCVSRMDEREYA